MTVLTKVDSNAHPTRWRPFPAWDPELEKRNWAAACTQPHVFPLRTLCDQLAASPCRVYYPPQWTGPCTVSINNPSSLSCFLSDYCITARGKEMEALPLSHFLVCPKQNSGHSTQYNCPVSLLLSVFFFFFNPSPCLIHKLHFTRAMHVKTLCTWFSSSYSLEQPLVSWAYHLQIKGTEPRILYILDKCSTYH